MFEVSIQTKTYIVLGIMISCLIMVYPTFFHPILMNALGRGPPNTHDFFESEFPPTRPPRGGHGRPPPRPAHNTPAPTRSGGIMSVVLPVYAVGIVAYLIYTLVKVFSGPKSSNADKSEEYLRQYYRNFHYDATKGKFRMGHDSSDDDDCDLNISRKKKVNFGGFDCGPSDGESPGSYDWGKVYGDDSSSHLYRSSKSMPRDLAGLLRKVDDKSLSSDELLRLRKRLEETEAEMSRILEAMRRSEEEGGDTQAVQVDEEVVDVDVAADQEEDEQPPQSLQPTQLPERDSPAKSVVKRREKHIPPATPKEKPAESVPANNNSTSKSKKRNPKKKNKKS